MGASLEYGKVPMVPVSYMLVRVQKKDGTKTVNGGGATVRFVAVKEGDVRVLYVPGTELCFDCVRAYLFMHPCVCLKQRQIMQK